MWSETHFTVVTYAGEGRRCGRVGALHADPLHPEDVHRLYADRGRQFAAHFTTSTGATLSFPNLYADIAGIPWLFGGTAWAGTRYYKRESVYISDFFYWNPSGVGAGIEDINLGKDLRLSYAAFAVDGRLVPPPVDARAAARDAVRLRHPKRSAASRDQVLGERRVPDRVPVHRELQQQPRHQWRVGRHRSDSCRRCSAATTRLVFQYGKGAGTGFGTLARYYYPDFSLYNDPERAPDSVRRRAHHSARQRMVWRPGGRRVSSMTTSVTRAGTELDLRGRPRERRRHRALQAARRGRLRPGDEEQRRHRSNI